MAANPYIFDGQVKDTGLNGSAGAVKGGVMVRIFNCSTGEWIYHTTIASGNYALDAANLPSQYTDGDKIIVSAYIKGKSVDYITTIFTPNGGETKDLVLMEGDTLVPFYPSGSRISTPTNLNAYSISNSAGSAARLDFYEVYTGNKLLGVEVPTHNTVGEHFVRGIPFAGGIAKVPSADATLVPTVEAGS